MCKSLHSPTDLTRDSCDPGRFGCQHVLDQSFEILSISHHSPVLTIKHLHGRSAAETIQGVIVGLSEGPISSIQDSLGVTGVSHLSPFTWVKFPKRGGLSVRLSKHIL